MGDIIETCLHYGMAASEHLSPMIWQCHCTSYFDSLQAGGVYLILLSSYGHGMLRTISVFQVLVRIEVKT